MGVILLLHILLDTFVPNVVFLTFSSLQILGKTQTRIYPVSEFLVNPVKTKIVINLEAVVILAMKVAPVTEPAMRNTAI